MQRVKQESQPRTVPVSGELAEVVNEWFLPPQPEPERKEPEPKSTAVVRYDLD